MKEIIMVISDEMNEFLEKQGKSVPNYIKKLIEKEMKDDKIMEMINNQLNLGSQEEEKDVSKHPLDFKDQAK